VVWQCGMDEVEGDDIATLKLLNVLTCRSTVIPGVVTGFDSALHL
jgi:hypothetical protein